MPPLRTYAVIIFGAWVGTAVAASTTVLKIGYFPNLTHAQGLIGAHSTKTGKGWFETSMGTDLRLQWYPFNAGPSAMEAILAGTIDLTYVGPNPALNAYIRSRGKEIRVLAGATEGGAALVVAADGRIKTASDFRGRKIGTPQLGNTQDVAARAWLLKNGLRVTLTGGDAQVIPTANPDQLALFKQGRLDAVWTVEPWVSRLEIEAAGKVLVEQSDALVTLLVASEKACARQHDVILRFVTAHAALTRWIEAHPDEAKDKVRQALSSEIRRDFDPRIVAAAWKRMRFTDAITAEQFKVLVEDAQRVGFLRDAIPLDQLFSRKP